MTMNIRLNGQDEEFKDGATLIDILKEKDINPETIIAEVDEVILKPEEFEGCKLNDGSVVEILRFVGGG